MLLTQQPILELKWPHQKRICLLIITLDWTHPACIFILILIKKYPELNWIWLSDISHGLSNIRALSQHHKTWIRWPSLNLHRQQLGETLNLRDLTYLMGVQEERCIILNVMRQPLHPSTIFRFLQIFSHSSSSNFRFRSLSYVWRDKAPFPRFWIIME